MIQDAEPQAAPSSSPDLRQQQNSMLVKMITIAVLGLLLLIPLFLVRSVLTERLARRDEALKDITSTWGSFGPGRLEQTRPPSSTTPVRIIRHEVPSAPCQSVPMQNSCRLNLCPEAIT